MALRLAQTLSTSLLNSYRRTTAPSPHSSRIAERNAGVGFTRICDDTWARTRSGRPLSAELELKRHGLVAAMVGEQLRQRLERLPAVRRHRER